MNVIVHDTNIQDFEKKHANDTVYAMRFLKRFSYCLGCYGCWTGTPGICVIEDELQRCAIASGNATNVFIITKITYGGYSSLTKVFLDRSLGYAMPYFTKRDNEIHHLLRYPQAFRLYVIGYGANNMAEVETFHQLVRENAINFKTNAIPYVTTTPQEAMYTLHEIRKELRI